MKYLRNTHHIEVGSNQTQLLRNLGYYHGFKGYRFIRNDADRINFSSLDEIAALNKFDMQLKTILYPKVMFIENALKSYVIEGLLKDSNSENFEDIFNRSLTAYKQYSSGSKKYIEEYKKRMILKQKINVALVRDYEKRKVVSHFFNNDIVIPIWAIFETLTLGEFGTLFACSSSKVKLYVSKIMKLPAQYDSDGRITQFFIYTIKDLRNAIAHNTAVFDTRFKTGDVSKRFCQLLEKETGIINIDFNYMDAYVIMIVYFLRKMGDSKTSCKQFIASYQAQTDYLRSTLPISICNKILGTQHKDNMNKLKLFISKS